ncbi:MAG: DUF4135 domain-containing protein, partial [Cellvibrionales bacterium]|nr:DUF4135 domain-containing protein [Cellvibrionales bacterium]
MDIVTQRAQLLANHFNTSNCSQLPEGFFLQLAEGVTHFPPSPTPQTLADHLWFSANVLFIERLIKDQDLLASSFDFHTESIKSVSAGLSDPHNGWHSVAILEDINGTKVVYKPRPIGIDLWVSQLLQWINKKDPSANLYAPQYIDVTDYGWMEYIEPSACQSEAEIPVFFHQLGSLLAIATVFSGKDLHFENIIAKGHQPVIIDPECFLVPPLSTPHLNTVLDTGLLPNWIEGTDKRQDYSALGYPVLHLKKTSPQHQKLIACTPTFDANLYTYLGFEAQLIEGFEQRLQWLHTHQHELFASEWFHSTKDMIDVRLTLRPTAVYVDILTAAKELADIATQPQVDNFIYNQLVRKPAKKKSTVTINAEWQALQQGDIPCFYLNANACPALSQSARSEPLLSGFDHVKSQLQALTTSNRQFQTTLIRQSLSLHQPQQTTYLTSWQQPTPLASPASLNQSFIELAIRCADHMIDSGLKTDNRFEFFYQYANSNPELCSLHFHNGKSGILYFLLMLYQQAPQDNYLKVIKNLTEDISQSLLNAHHLEPASGYLASAGTLLTLAESYRLWPTPETHKAIERLAFALKNLASKKNNNELNTSLGQGIYGDLIAFDTLYQITQQRLWQDHADFLASRLRDATTTLSDTTLIDPKKIEKKKPEHFFDWLLQPNDLNTIPDTIQAQYTNPGIFTGSTGAYLCEYIATQALKRKDTHQKHPNTTGLQTSAKTHIASILTNNTPLNPGLDEGYAGIGLACLYFTNKEIHLFSGLI